MEILNITNPFLNVGTIADATLMFPEAQLTDLLNGGLFIKVALHEVDPQHQALEGLETLGEGLEGNYELTIRKRLSDILQTIPNRTWEQMTRRSIWTRHLIIPIDDGVEIVEPTTAMVLASSMEPGSVAFYKSRVMAPLPVSDVFYVSNHDLKELMATLTRLSFKKSAGEWNEILREEVAFLKELLLQHAMDLDRIPDAYLVSILVRCYQQMDHSFFAMTSLRSLIERASEDVFLTKGEILLHRVVAILKSFPVDTRIPEDERFAEVPPGNFQDISAHEVIFIPERDFHQA